MQRHLNGLCLACKEKTLKLSSSLKYIGKNWKIRCIGSLPSHHCKEPNAACNTCTHCNIAVSARWAMMQTRGCSNSSLAVITFSDSSSAPGRERDDMVSGQHLPLSHKRTKHPQRPPSPDVGCIHQAVTLWKQSGLSACVKRLGWKNERLFSKSVARSNACKL